MKTSNYNKYGFAAKEAALISGNPVESWKIAVKDFDSESSKTKGCPKNAFLGLCEAGFVKGIKSGSYFKSKKPNLNKKYAIKAVELLISNSNLSEKELWELVREELNLGVKKHNSQMDVVIALWENGLIELRN
tara:strand:- start:155 stop:553 length:399 start_codon:yes stop_codon:yes gene_type:complete